MEHVWSGALEKRDGAQKSLLARMLNPLLVVPTACFITKLDGCAPFALYAGKEVLPGISLSDVLFEEYGFEICEHAIVLIEPHGRREGLQNLDPNLGAHLGNILVGLACLEQQEVSKVSDIIESLDRPFCHAPQQWEAEVVRQNWTAC